MNARLGWFCGSNNMPPYIARTPDGGATWDTQDLSPRQAAGVESISMIEPSLGWAVNSSGTVYKTTNGGVTSMPFGGAMAPGQLTLDQNYPNPFNPSTTIRYGLPQRSHVTLTVFNTLGQLVAQLVNGEMEAGYHEVQFGGSGLSSGVYYYRIQAGDFVQTRKLLLLR
jgi:hypothetical protein